MIEYSKTASDNKYRIQDLTWMNGRLFAMISIVAFILGGNFFLAGILGKSDAALNLGLRILTIAAVALVIFITVHNKTKKAVLTNFEEFEVDGQIDFTIEQIDEETMELTRLTDEQSFQIGRGDIKKIRYMKHTNIIILNDKRTVDIPKRVDISEVIRFQQQKSHP